MKATVSRLERRAKNLDAVLARGAGSTELKLGIERDLHRLQPWQRQTFRRSLSLSKAQIVTATLVATDAFVREQGHER